MAVSSSTADVGFTPTPPPRFSLLLFSSIVLLSNADINTRSRCSPKICGSRGVFQAHKFCASKFCDVARDFRDCCIPDRRANHAAQLSQDVGSLDAAETGAVAPDFALGRLKNVPDRHVKRTESGLPPANSNSSSSSSSTSSSLAARRRRLAITNKAVFANQSECYTLQEGDPAYGQLQEYDYGPPGFFLRAGYPAFDVWIPSQTNWVMAGIPTHAPDQTPYHSSIVAGELKYAVDRDLQSALHLDSLKPAWMTFDMQTPFTISAVKIYTSWTSGPRQVSFQFAPTEAGPWEVAGDFVVEGEDHVDILDPHTDDLVMRGALRDGHTRAYDKKATVALMTGAAVQNSPNGRVTARYWRMWFNSSYLSESHDRTYANLAPGMPGYPGYGNSSDDLQLPYVRPLIIVEIGFLGMESEVAKYTQSSQLCAYPQVMNAEGVCAYLEKGT